MAHVRMAWETHHLQFDLPSVPRQTGTTSSNGVGVGNLLGLGSCIAAENLSCEPIMCSKKRQITTNNLKE